MWTKVAKKNQWKYVKPIVKKAMKSGKMEAIGKTEGFIYTALDGIRRSVYFLYLYFTRKEKKMDKKKKMVFTRN